MKLAYISPSVLPSRSANAIHVAMQCYGLSRAGAEVTLYAKRAIARDDQLPRAVSEAYGIDAGAFKIKSFHSNHSKGDNWRIAALALGDAGLRSADAILSRNLYASFVLAVLKRRRILFETHQLEQGIRKRMQGAIMRRPWVTTVAISQQMIKFLSEHHGSEPSDTLVLHDAAPDDIEAVAPEQRRSELLKLVPTAAGDWDAVCGYFGHLYAGRGIEIIQAMAAARPRVLFLVYGGNDSDIARYRDSNPNPNLRYMGFLPHSAARKIMPRVDALLMPYQQSVAIGAQGHDTARWMSPMKMFEYLMSGVPVISSDLPVLREVLQDQENALLAAPTSADQWIAALDRLLAAPAFAHALGSQGRRQCLEQYTWTRRAERLLQAAGRP